MNHDPHTNSPKGALMNRVTAILICLSIAMCAIVPFAHGTQIVYQTPQQLGHNAELVVHGTVVSVESQWDDQRAKIFTTTRIAVEDTYKGAGSPLVEIIQLGGVVGNVRVNVSGALQWAPGEEVLLFLEPYLGKYAVSGFSQGKFLVQRDPESGDAYVRRPSLDGVEIQGAPSVDGSPRSSAMADMPLQDFVDRALADGKKGGSR